MFVDVPTITCADGEIRVSSRFELRTAAVRVPDTLWFTFPERYATCVSGRSDGFATALVLLAMLCGEDIELRGVLSPRLAEGLAEYQRLFSLWLPNHLRPVSVSATRYAEPSGEGRSVACAFSGGIDSFYTLRTHLQREATTPGCQLTHALFVHGYDIPLADRQTFRAAAESYDEMLRQLGVDLVTARTNIHDVLSPTVGWEWAHGAALISIALMFDRCLARFYVPSSHTYADTYPWGSDSRLDHLLSTGTLQVIHDGASASRAEKAAFIAEWPETYGRLRVCWENPDGLMNCGRCRKCIRTMITLETLGVLQRYRTFAHALTRRDIRTCRFLHGHERRLARQVIRDAAARGRRDLAFDLRYALVRSRLKSWQRRIARSLGQMRSRAGIGKAVPQGRGSQSPPDSAPA